MSTESSSDLSDFSDLSAIDCDFEEFLDDENSLDFSATSPTNSHIVTVHNYLKSMSKENDLSKTNPIASARIKSFLIYLRTIEGGRGAVQICKDFKIEIENLLGFEMVNYPNYSRTDGLSEKEIDKLPRYVYKNRTKSFKCCICINLIKFGDDLMEIELCHHKFHSNCLSKWLKRSNQCPICRSSVI